MMQANKLQAMAFVFCLAYLLSVPGGVQGYPVVDPTRDYERLGPARQAGLRADRARIPALVAILQEKPTPTRFLMETTLLSVAQLGATDALPAINALAQGAKDQDGKDLVEPDVVSAARARLIAEAAAGPDTGTPAQAQAKLGRFYQELGETPAALNAVMRGYEAAQPKAADLPPRNPVEFYAIRQLADMAYRSAYRGFAQLPGVSQVDFALDARSALKVRLAPLSDAERAAWLVQDLSRKAVFGDTENAEAQLGGELGTAASAVAAAKLQEMGQHTAQYKHAAFTGLFNLLVRSGGPERTLLDHFKNDPDPTIAGDAGDGGRGELIAGY